MEERKERKSREQKRKEPVIPRAYSMDLRERLVRTVEGGMSVRQAACQLMIDDSCALKWMRQFRGKGNVEPKRQGGYRKSVLLPHTRWILQYIEQKPDETLGENRQSLIQKGVRVGIATLWRFFQRHQISIKKS
jgi:transposase